MVLGRAGSAVARPLRPLVTESGSGTLQVDAVAVICQVSKWKSWVKGDNQ